ncbi:hypothetical protein K431DRAFT_93557 [Polychaeton citri CBS 116435]|uniref:Uncharacterized protein n=1 Tax=Polychaeton citri CBS 116435 TaxID=1314669 RepID=A0A9P4Q8J2_9PEZI|nr:hypothetical protein K431DRAFT_93557 [Polychaeton citri CBS 116435]
MVSATMANKGSDPFEETVVPSLKVGAFTGAAGFLVGGTAGILKAQTPFLYASASAIQTGLLGAAFWGFRTTILSAWSVREVTRRDLTLASAISGSLSGSIIGGVTRGRANVVPAAVMFGLFGSLGQVGVNWYHNAPRRDDSQHKEGFWKRMAEKMLKLDVEIAILDDKIAEQKKASSEQVQVEAEETSSKGR